MGIDYSAVHEYGVAFSLEEANDACEKLGLGEDQDEPYEVLAAHYDLISTTYGNAYTGDEWFIIGPTSDESTCNIIVDPDGLKRLRQMLSELELDDEPEWYTETHIW